MYILILCLAICLKVPVWFYIAWAIVIALKFLAYCERVNQANQQEQINQMKGDNS